MACALPELGHPGIQLLLVPHLKDDVCPVLHLARRKGVAVWVPWVCRCDPRMGKAINYLQDKGIEVVRHLEACAPPNLLDTGAGCL